MWFFAVVFTVSKISLISSIFFSESCLRVLNPLVIPKTNPKNIILFVNVMIDKVNLSCDGSINEEESLYRGGSNTKSTSEGAIVSGQRDLHQDARGPPWCTIQEWIIIMSTCLAFSGIRIEISSTTADDLVTPNDKLNGNSQIWIEKSTWIFYDGKIRIWTVPRQPFCWSWVKPSNQNWPNLTMFFNFSGSLPAFSVHNF